MEIKDVNNVVNQFLSFRSQGAAASGGALGAGFASFMSQTADILSATGSKEAVKTASAERPEHADKSSKPAERTEDKKTKPSKKERSDESAAAPAAENTERKMKTPEKADAAAVQNTSASEPEPKSAAPAEAPVMNAPAETGAAGKPVLQVNPQGETRTTELNVALLGTDSAASFAAVMDGMFTAKSPENLSNSCRWKSFLPSRKKAARLFRQIIWQKIRLLMTIRLWLNRLWRWMINSAADKR